MIKQNRINMIKDKAEECGSTLLSVELEEEIKPIHVFLKPNLDDNVRRQLIHGFDEMSFCRLNLKLVDLGTHTGT
jgi:hypothetical protein